MQKKHFKNRISLHVTGPAISWGCITGNSQHSSAPLETLWPALAPWRQVLTADHYAAQCTCPYLDQTLLAQFLQPISVNYVWPCNNTAYSRMMLTLYRAMCMDSWFNTTKWRMSNESVSWLGLTMHSHGQVLTDHPDTFTKLYVLNCY